MSQVHRFVPRRTEATKDNYTAAVMGALFVPAVLYFGEGQRNWGTLLGTGVGVGVLVLVLYSLRARMAWIDAIELTPEGVTLEKKGERDTLPWTAVKSVRHGNRGGVHWALSPRGAHPSMLIRGDGLSPEECRTITDLIRAYHENANAGVVRA